MQLKKSAATLDELTAREEEIKTSIRDLQKQQKQIRVTRKAFQRLQASLPQEKPQRRAKKAESAAA